MKIKVYGMSSEGKRGTKIEDYFGIFPPQELQDYDERNIYIVADGMGGCKGGEIASKKAVESMLNFFSDNVNIDNKFMLSSKDNISKRLEYAILNANYKLRQEILKNLELEGMGTTVVAVHIHNDKLYIAYVGDSRSYRIRNNKIECLTKDHSLVQELYDAGQITAQQLKTHPKRNIITRALGVEDEVRCDLRIEKIDKNDIILLCSDGLHGVLEDERIKEVVIQQNANLETTCIKLIEQVINKGGKDDITILVIQIISQNSI